MAKERPDELHQGTLLYATASAFSSKLAPTIPDLAPAVGPPDVASLSGYAAWLQVQCQEHLTALASVSPAPVYTPMATESHQAATSVYPVKATEVYQAAPPQYTPQLSMLTPTHLGGHSPYLQNGDSSSLFMQQWLEGLSAVPSSQAAQASGMHGQLYSDGFAMGANASSDHTDISHLTMLTQQALLNAAERDLNSCIQKRFETASANCMEPDHFRGELQHRACVLLLYVDFVQSFTMLACFVGVGQGLYLHCCVT